jgi:hypothetical protein
MREPWLAGEFRPFVHTREAVERHAAHRLTLTPGARMTSR